MTEYVFQPQRAVAFYGGAVSEHGGTYLEFLSETVQILKAHPNAVSFYLPQRKSISSYKTRKSKTWLDIVRDKGAEYLASIEQIEDNDYRKRVSALDFPSNKVVSSFSADSANFSILDAIRITVSYSKLRNFHYGFSQVRRGWEASSWAEGIAMSGLGKEDMLRTAMLGRAMRDDPSILARKMHDVYEMNVLSRDHLDAQVKGTGLERWIVREGFGRLTQVSTDLTAWTLTQQEIAAVRPVLLDAGVLIVES
jgi:hypothetical protein